MHLVIFKSTFQVDKYIWNSYTVHSGTKFSDCLSAWKYLISKKIPELGEENPLSEFCTWANAQVLAGVRSLDPRESSSIAGLQITSQGMEDKKNSKAHFPAMRTESAVKQKCSPIHLGAMDNDTEAEINQYSWLHLPQLQWLPQFTQERIVLVIRQKTRPCFCLCFKQKGQVKVLPLSQSCDARKTEMPA